MAGVTPSSSATASATWVFATSEPSPSLIELKHTFPKSKTEQTILNIFSVSSVENPISVKAFSVSLNSAASSRLTGSFPSSCCRYKKLRASGETFHLASVSRSQPRKI